MKNQTTEVIFRFGQSNEKNFHANLLTLIERGYRFAHSITHKDHGGVIRQIVIRFTKSEQ